MTPRITKLKTSAERFCDKLNDGLAAVAFVLAVAVFMAGTYRTIEQFDLTAQDGAPPADLLAGQSVPE